MENLDIYGYMFKYKNNEVYFFSIHLDACAKAIYRIGYCLQNNFYKERQNNT